jgi:hypothetical protein
MLTMYEMRFGLSSLTVHYANETFFVEFWKGVRVNIHL